MPKRSLKKPSPPQDTLLIETAWEVCNQVGGIYTVIRSKAPAMMENHSGNFCMIGPYLNKNIQAELEPLDSNSDIFGQAAANLSKKGYDVIYAEWLITGKPKVVLLNPNAVEEKALGVIKYLLWKNHNISTPTGNTLIDQVIGFAYLTKLFFDELVKLAGTDKKIIGHFHEWMAGLPIMDIKRDEMPVKTIFTTHAT